MFDVWFDGESVEPVVMQQLETKLQEAFNLPAAKAAVLAWRTSLTIGLRVVGLRAGRAGFTRNTVCAELVASADFAEC